jgi:hypothetical protein
MPVSGFPNQTAYVAQGDGAFLFLQFMLADQDCCAGQHKRTIWVCYTSIMSTS